MPGAAATTGGYNAVQHAHDASLIALNHLLTGLNVSTEVSRLVEAFRLNWNSATERETEAFAQRKTQANQLPADEHWDRQRLSHVCGLLVQQRPWRSKPLLAQTAASCEGSYDADDDSASSMSLRHAVKFSAALASLTTDARFPETIRTGFQAAAQLCTRAAFLPRDLIDMADAIDTKLSVERERHFVRKTVTTSMNTINALLPDVRNCEYLMHRTTEDGEMAEAERVAEGQLRLYERLLQLIYEQYDALEHHGRTDAANEKRHRWTVFRSARHDVRAVVQRLERRTAALQDDAARVRFVVEEASQEDSEATSRYRTLMSKFQQEITQCDENVDAQLVHIADLQEQIRQAEAAIAVLARRRLELSAERNAAVEADARRSRSHEDFLREANQYLSEAKQQLDRMDTASQATALINNLILEGAANIADRHLESQQRADDIVLALNKEHVTLLTEYALCATRHCHRKLGQWAARNEAGLNAEMRLELAVDRLDPEARRHAANRDASQSDARSLWEEVRALQGVIAEHFVAFESRCATNLRRRGVSFLHPADLAHDATTQRREVIALWRDAADVTPAKLRDALKQEAAVVAEDLRRLRAAESTRRLRLSHTSNIGSQSAYTTFHTLVASPPQRGRPGSAVLRPRQEDRTVAEAMQQFDRMLDDLTRLPRPSAAEATTTDVAQPPAADTTNSKQRLADQAPPDSTRTFLQQRPSTAPVTRSQHSAVAKMPRTVEAAPLAATKLSFEESRALPVSKNAQPNRRVEGEASDRNEADSHLRSDLLITPTRQRLTATANHNYVATAPDELSFGKGDVILVMSKGEDDGWYRGALNHRVGLFPGNYVRFRRADPPESTNEEPNPTRCVL